MENKSSGICSESRYVKSGPRSVFRRYRAIEMRMSQSLFTRDNAQYRQSVGRYSPSAAWRAARWIATVAIRNEVIVIISSLALDDSSSMRFSLVYGFACRGCNRAHVHIRTNPTRAGVRMVTGSTRRAGVSLRSNTGRMRPALGSTCGADCLPNAAATSACYVREDSLRGIPRPLIPSNLDDPSTPRLPGKFLARLRQLLRQLVWITRRFNFTWRAAILRPTITEKHYSTTALVVVINSRFIHYFSNSVEVKYCIGWCIIVLSYSEMTSLVW